MSGFMYRRDPQGDMAGQNGNTRPVPPDPRQPVSTFRPPVAPAPSGYLQSGTPYANTAPSPFGAAPYNVPQGQQYDAPPEQEQPQQGYLQPAGQQPIEEDVSSQMGSMNIEGDATGAPKAHKKKHRHAYHNLEPDLTQQPASPAFPGGPQGGVGSPGASPQPWAPQGAKYGGGVAPAQVSSPTLGTLGGSNFVASVSQQGIRASTPLRGTPASSMQGKVDPEQIPGIPASRDSPAQYYLEHVYPTMESHLPPPASIPFVAVDQGNSTPKVARLTLNNIPASADALATTGLPLGLILQPLAALQDGEQPIPVVDFGETGPPRCRRCRAYINPFMTFRSGGSKFVCNMCTFPNDTATEYFAPTDPSGVRVDRMQRPELTLGTVEFTAPKEYWTKEPVPLRWLFAIDVTMESTSRGFLEGFCQGILSALYGNEMTSTEDGDRSALKEPSIAPGARVGFMTYDREVQFYNVSSSLEHAQMVVMPDMDDPFVPISEGLFVDPLASRAAITSLLTQLPTIFSKVKFPEPCLLPTLNAAFNALKATGGRVVCSLASLPTWGPGRLFLREKPEMRDVADAEKKLFTTEHNGFKELAKKMTEQGVGADFFLAASQGGYLDIATIGLVSEKTGGEVYYYPSFQNPRDLLKLSKEITHAISRDSGFQALLKVRCSNGLQVSGYFGNFTQHTFGADLEFGVIDSDKAFGVTFSYDGKLDSKLDAHFQSALLYTTASGERRIRCSNIVAAVSENSMDSMKLVDQDAVIGIIAKQAAAKIPDRTLKDIRASITEKTIDIMSAYRKNFSGSHPPGQLVLPENLKEFSMYMLGLLKSRALKAGHEPTDRRMLDLRLLKSMGLMELSLYLYPRVIPIHSLDELDGFPNDNGYLRMAPQIRASYSRIDDGGAYIVDSGQTVLLWLHANTSPNLLEDLFGPGMTSLSALDPFTSALPVLETHLNAQVRNILQYLEDNRGSKAMTLQLARQGLGGAEYEFARLLFEDRNNEAQSYVDWLVHVHRHVQMELQGQRKKDEGESGGEGAASGVMASLRGLSAPYW